MKFTVYNEDARESGKFTRDNTMIEADTFNEALDEMITRGWLLKPGHRYVLTCESNDFATNSPSSDTLRVYVAQPVLVREGAAS